MAPETFDELLTRQVGHEFAASHQYVAVAVRFDSQDLPPLARHVYRQPLEERNRAMMIVQYILDRDLPLTVPGAGEVRNDFAAARAEGDPLGEQFILWFRHEQVQEVASMTTLVNIARRADNLFDIENYLARERVGDGGHHGAAAPGRRRPPVEPSDPARRAGPRRRRRARSARSRPWRPAPPRRAGRHRARGRPHTGRVAVRCGRCS